MIWYSRCVYDIIRNIPVLCITSIVEKKDMYVMTICLFVLLLQNGHTALHLAASNNHPEVIKVLISNGADITVIDKV